MAITKIFALISLLLGLFFTWFTFHYRFSLDRDLVSFFLILSFMGAFLYTLLVYLILKNKKIETKKLFSYVFSMLQPIAWLFIMLTSDGTTGMSSVVSYIAMLTYVVIVFIILKKNMGKFSYIISLLTLIVVLLGILHNLEAQYCWSNGENIASCHANFNLLSDLKKKYLLII